MKLIILFLTFVAIAFAAPASDEIVEDSVSELDERPENALNNLDIFIERMAEWEIQWAHLSPEERTELLHIMEERMEKLKEYNELTDGFVNRFADEEIDDDVSEESSEESSSEESSSEESSEESLEDIIGDLDLPEIAPIPVIAMQHMEPDRVRQQMDDFLNSRDEWNDHWANIPTEKREMIERHIRERMEKIREAINRHTPSRHHQHHEFHHRHHEPLDPEVKKQIMEASENVIDYIRTRVQAGTPTFPQEEDKEKIMEFFRGLPEDVQKHMNRHLEKFDRMPEEKREEVMEHLREHFMALPDRETRHKDMEVAIGIFMGMKDYVEARLNEENSNFPQDVDFQKGQEAVQSLPDYMKNPILKKMQEAQQKFNEIPDEKKEKARKRIQRKLKKMIKTFNKHHPQAVPYEEPKEQKILEAIAVIGA
jgi:ElaB/YqjD/DUF883 family membrane-anchored ribosome-binding protein